MEMTLELKFVSIIFGEFSVLVTLGIMWMQ